MYVPALSAACITMLPSVTSTFLPSSSISTIYVAFFLRSGLDGRLRDITRDQGLELMAKVLDHGPHRHRGGIAQRANRAALNVVGDRIQQVHVRSLAVAVVDPVDHAPEPAG